MLRAAVFALSMVSVFSAPALAEGFVAEQIVERVLVTTDENGSETRAYEIAEEVAPGDEVRYSLIYVNEGTEAVEDVNLVMPIPAEVTYIEASATGSATSVTYSDDGESFTPREDVTVGEGDAVRIAGRKSTRLNSSHANISYAVFCLKKKTE